MAALGQPIDFAGWKQLFDFLKTSSNRKFLQLHFFGLQGGGNGDFLQGAGRKRKNKSRLHNFCNAAIINLRTIYFAMLNLILFEFLISL